MWGHKKRGENLSRKNIRGGLTVDREKGSRWVVLAMVVGGEGAYAESETAVPEGTVVAQGLDPHEAIALSLNLLEAAEEALTEAEEAARARAEMALKERRIIQ